MPEQSYTPLLSSGLALSTLLFASPGHALTFTGNSNGLWGEPLSNDRNPRVDGIGTSTFTWGIATEIGTSPNQLVFQGNPVTTETGALFKVGDLTYFNGTILENTGIASVPLNFELSFDDPATLSQVFSIDFEILTTPNNGTPDENADAVIPSTLVSQQSFSANELNYTLSLVGFSQDGGLTTTEEFRVREDARTTASLFGRIIPVSPESSEPASRIPEPGAIAGLSIVAWILGMNRRKGSLSK